MRFLGWLGFLPDEALGLLVAVAGLLMVVGLRRYAAVLLMSCVLLALAPAVLDPVFAVLPVWAMIGLAMLSVWLLLPKRRRKRER